MVKKLELNKPPASSLLPIDPRSLKAPEVSSIITNKSPPRWTLKAFSLAFNGSSSLLSLLIIPPDFISAVNRTVVGRIAPITVLPAFHCLFLRSQSPRKEENRSVTISILKNASDAISSPLGRCEEKRTLSLFTADSISSPMLKLQQEFIQNILHLLEDDNIKQKIKGLFVQEDVIFPGESFTITKNERIRPGNQIIYLTRMARFTGLLLFLEGEICGDRKIEVLGEPGLPKSLNRDFLVIEGDEKIPFKEYAGEYVRSRVFPEFKFEYSMGSELNGKIVVEQGGFITKDVITGRFKIYGKSHKTSVIKDGIISKLSCISTIPCRAHIPRGEEVHLWYHTHPNIAPVRASLQDLHSIVSNFKQSGKYISEIIINPDRKARIYILKDIPPIEEWDKSDCYPKEEEIMRYFHIVELEFSEEGDISHWEELAGSPLEGVLSSPAVTETALWNRILLRAGSSFGDEFFPGQLNIVEDRLDQSLAQFFSFMKGNNSATAVGMAEEDMAAFLADCFKAEFSEDFDYDGWLKAGQAHYTDTSCRPTNSSLLGVSTSRHKDMASLILFNKTGRVFAWVWQPFKAVAVAISIPSSSRSINTVNSFFVFIFTSYDCLNPTIYSDKSQVLYRGYIFAFGSSPLEEEKRPLSILT